MMIRSNGLLIKVPKWAIIEKQIWETLVNMIKILKIKEASYKINERIKSNIFNIS